VRFDDHALRALARYDWPGNVRELSNVIERLAIARAGAVVGVADLPAKIARDADAPAAASAARTGVERFEAGLLDPERPPLLPVNGIDLKEYMSRLERSLIQQALDDTHSVVARAADRLHIRRTTLVEKMRKYGLQRSDSVEP
jgi:sigma-54 specific flagellar transcriptional regulator A